MISRGFLFCGTGMVTMVRCVEKRCEKRGQAPKTADPDRDDGCRYRCPLKEARDDQRLSGIIEQQIDAVIGERLDKAVPG